MRFALLASAALLVAAPALAQAPPPPGPGIPAAPGLRPPPPPSRGPGVIVDRGTDHTFHVDVHCSENETTKACADLATQLIDKLNGAVQAK